LFDPHRDPHGEMSGRKQWNKQAATSSFLDKKTPQSLIQQGMEGSTVVGKFRYQPRKQLLRLPINIGEVAVQFTTCQ